MEKSLIQAARGDRPERTPVWFLRQAGRYLPEYQRIRAEHTFEELYRTPSLAKEVTLQPMRRFDLDAAIIFSDILVPCVGMGQELSFVADHGPRLVKPIRSAHDVARLKVPEPYREFSFVGEALQLVKPHLAEHQALIGFAGAPFTVASYMIEGEGSKDYRELKRFCYHDPAAFISLLEMISATTLGYLAMQVQAGAECLMLFDSWAHQMAPLDFRDIVTPVLGRFFAKLRSITHVPLIYYPGQSFGLYEELAGMQVDVVAVDWRIRLDHAARNLASLGLDVTLQGNLDPSVLLGPEALIRYKTREVLLAAKEARAHIFNVGHGLLPHVSPDALAIVIDEVRLRDRLV